MNDRERLVHDVACATTQHVFEVIVGCLRADEQQDAFEEIYARVKAGIECFEKHHNRMEPLLHPGNN